MPQCGPFISKLEGSRSPSHDPVSYIRVFNRPRRKMQNLLMPVSSKSGGGDARMTAARGGIAELLDLTRTAANRQPCRSPSQDRRSETGPSLPLSGQGSVERREAPIGGASQYLKILLKELQTYFTTGPPYKTGVALRQLEYRVKEHCRQRVAFPPDSLACDLICPDHPSKQVLTFR
ncbi:hypothetical protein BDZ90DRAFT_127181 [Jaminaea rosea]|uniref:Uncharacterized protein n=1 Tax=Jaminaea rosea TaxID=1569628 RepID=A0A316UHF3_9BASI|nr:hypothetical protein BDZ90DRAFT_127181 [Jaminaea rosea]PWN24334.1 hypothetical protein BDZ90DRAFT_127181 [Jaminaea rosea]